MLIENFYTTIDIIEDETNVHFRIDLNEDHEVYKGHFEEQPVVPGVIQLQILKEVLENYLSKDLFMGNVIQVKYLVPIIPQSSPQLDLHIQKILVEGTKVNTNATIGVGDQIFTKAKVGFDIQ